MMEKRISLTDAALALGLNYHQCRARVLRGELKGGKDEFGRLYADAKAVRASLKSRKNRPPDNQKRGVRGDANG
jgi:hypothetical protein